MNFIRIVLISLFLSSTPAAAEPWSEFHVASKWRPWGNQESYNMEKAFQRAGLPDDGCWEDNDPYLLCVIGFERKNEPIDVCIGGISSEDARKFDKCSYDQVDYIILYHFNSKGAPETRFVETNKYVCRHPTGTDPWPKALCSASKVSFRDVPDLVENKLMQTPGMRDLFIERGIIR